LCGEGNALETVEAMVEDVFIPVIGSEAFTIERGKAK
jgi:hypothetical protein